MLLYNKIKVGGLIMRIILYLISLMGFIILAFQIASAIAGLLTYLVILLVIDTDTDIINTYSFFLKYGKFFKHSLFAIGVIALIIGYAIKFGLIAGTFITETACSLADSVNYYDIQNEREQLRHREQNPNIRTEEQYQLRLNRTTSLNNLNKLQQVYPFAEAYLFGRYAKCIERRQFNLLNDIENSIKQSHRNNMNNLCRR